MKADPNSADIDTTIREEGNAVHWLASAVFNKEFDQASDMVDRKAPNGVFITPDMADHVTDYLSVTDRSPNSIRFIEHETSHSGTNYRVNGRADQVSHNGVNVFVDDFKYGYTIVEPEMNWPLISHAIGFCSTLPFQPEEIIFTIIQPRASHIDGSVRQWSISCRKLLELYQILSNTLNAPNNLLNTGAHCYKCPAYASCVARMNAELNAIEATAIAFNANITDAELSARIETVDRAVQLLQQTKKAYEEQVIHRIKNGAVFPKLSMQDDFANRSWKDWATAETVKALTGKDLTKAQLISPRQAELAGISSEVIATLTERKFKGSKLVKGDVSKKAKKLFGDRKP